MPALNVSPTCASPDTTGNPVFTGTDNGGGALTAAVGSDSATGEGPAPFVAVTATRSVRPTSPVTGAYVGSVAAAIGLQLEPEQDCHWYAYELGLPLHAPALALSVWPTSGTPVTVGGAVFTGTDGGAAVVTVV